jgi:hypothetical protein
MNNLNFKYLTPEILRKAADSLSPVFAAARSMQWYTCPAIGVFGGSFAKDEYASFLLENKIVQDKWKSISKREFGTDNDIEKQAIRFMFLEFLALMLEDEQNAK